MVLSDHTDGDGEKRPTRDLHLAHRLADATAEISMAHFGREVRRWAKEDGRPGNEADVAVEDALRGLLARERPDEGRARRGALDGRASLTSGHLLFSNGVLHEEILRLMAGANSAGAGPRE